jgi:hypothetical protein
VPASGFVDGLRLVQHGANMVKGVFLFFGFNDIFKPIKTWT